MKFCEECGAQLNDNAKFCDECGSAVANKESDSNNADLKSKNNNSVVVFVIIIVVIGILVGVYFLTQQTNKATDDNITTEMTTELTTELTTTELTTEELTTEELTTEVVTEELTTQESTTEEIVEESNNYYTNSLYGYTVIIPSGFVMSSESDSGDGVIFKKGDLQINVWGSYNMWSDTPQSIVDTAISNGGVFYSEVGGTDCVYAYVNSDMVWVEGYAFTSEMMVGFCYTYPYDWEDDPALDDVANELIDYFKTGQVWNVR